MGNPGKRKGDRAERDLVAWLQNNGWPHVDRSLGAGRSADRGDVTGIPGTVIQVKDQKQIRVAEWLSETLAQTRAARADRGFLVLKRRQTASPARWFVVCELEALNGLLLDAIGPDPDPGEPAT